MSIIKIGTRASALALKQTNIVIEQLKSYAPENEYEIVEIVTKGDKQLNKPLYEFGGKAVFVDEFERSIMSGDIDMAIHSSKDMPMELLEGLTIAGVIKAHDSRDVLVYKKGTNLYIDNLRVGTSSLRRARQLKELMPNSKDYPLRGNVNTRLAKLRNDGYDAIILAAAGLERLDLLNEEDLCYRYFEPWEMIPASGQGIIAIETKESGEAYELARAISCEKSFVRLKYERLALKLLDAGCHEPIGIHFDIKDDVVTGYGMIADEDNITSKKLEEKYSGDVKELEEILAAMTPKLVEENA